jgi:drug/metabolite transporter (DMT)-like permease
VAGAVICYAAGALMIFRRHSDVPPLGVATSAMLVTTAILALPALLSLPDHVPPTRSVAALAMLGIACTGVRLVKSYRSSCAPVQPGRL